MTHSSNASLASQVAALPPEERASLIATLSEADVTKLLYDWRFWARPSQIAPDGSWLYWLAMAGRGWGKTRTGVEWVGERVDAGARHIILAGATAADVRDIMVDGESGILAKSPPWRRPVYEPSKARLTWPNGARGLLLSADEPERFRGKQSDTVWADELAAWRYPESWDQIKLGCRLGKNYGQTPRAFISTTPRPTAIMRALVEDPRTVVSRGSTFENAANLADEFITTIVRAYEGTRLGRQELYAELLTDTPGALWTLATLDGSRVVQAPVELRRIVIAVDPAVSSNKDSDETGIIVFGVGENGHGYVLEDLSGIYTPDGWGRRAIEAHQRWKADHITAEVNQGGDLVVANINAVARDMGVRVLVNTVHAARGKAVRAEPVAALYEQQRIHHVGALPKLEDQMTSWSPSTSSSSPDRVDALVWGATDLMIDSDAGAIRAAPRTYPTQFGANSTSTSGKFQW